MAAAAILDFQNREILFTIRVQSCETHQHAKFCQNQSICCEDIQIFQFFKTAAAAILYFRKREFLFAVSIGRDETHTVANFVKIGCSVAEILHFSNFQDGRHHHLGFLKSRNFTGYSGPDRGDAAACQISSKSVNRLKSY